MGGLARQVVPVLLKGLDQLAPRQTGIMSGLDALLNMYAQQGEPGGYEFAPRPGTTAINRPGGTGGTVGTRLATLNGQLLLFSDTALWRRALDGWHLVAGTGFGTGFTVSSQKTTPMFTEGIGGTSCDTAYVNGYTINATTGPSQPGATSVVNVTVTDANGATLDVPFRALSGAVQVRIAVVGTVAVIFWAETIGSSIRAVKFDSTAPSTFGPTSPTTVIVAGGGVNTTGTFNPIFDVQAIPSSSTIAIVYTSGGSTLAFKLLTPSTMTLGGTTSFPAKGLDLVSKGFLANNFSTNTLFVAYISTATGLHVDQFDASTFAAGTATVYDAAATVGASLTGYRTGASTATVYYTLKGTLPFDDVIKYSTGGASATYMQGRAIASRAMDISAGNVSLPLFLTKYRGVGQATYFLTDGNLGNPHDIARAMPDVAAADPTNALAGLLSLPNLMIGPTSSTYLTAGLKSVALESGASGLTSNTGAAAIAVVVGDPNVGRPVELNGVLHIPGAAPYLYDGATVSEEGFPLAPEQSDAYVIAAGGAMTASSTYTYRYVFEWTDKAGNLHRSAPNLVPQQAVLGAGQTQVTHSIPDVINSRKGMLSVAIERTPANGDGSVYYKVGSVSFIGIPGAASRLSFVDQMSDTTLVGGIPLYTNGNILENLAPPPCMAMAIHRGRILAGGIDGDPTAVWFSKDVVGGFGVAFNDGLVSRLGSSNETVTAIGSMDSYAAAFTGTTTWTSSDEYPDDTGAPGMLRFTQSSSTNGCAGAALIARADDGLTCWQAKTSFANGPGPGPWRFSRGGAWEWIGQAIQLDAAAVTNPRAILAVPGLNQMRIVGQTGSVNGNVLVRETTFNTWATWTYLVSPTGAPTIIDAIVWGGAVAYLGADGHVLLESTALYGDSATAIAHSITQSPYNFAGIAGYQRIYVGQLTGRVLGDVGLGESVAVAITQIIDGTAMAAKSRTLTPDADGLFGGVEFDPGPNGKCSSYQVTIANAAGGANDARCAWTLAAVTMEVGVKPNVNRVPPAKRAV